MTNSRSPVSLILLVLLLESLSISGATIMIAYKIVGNYLMFFCQLKEKTIRILN